MEGSRKLLIWVDMIDIKFLKFRYSKKKYK